MSDQPTKFPSTVINTDDLAYLSDVLRRERAAAEATLGRPLVDPYLFGFNCWRHGLGHALNVEQDRVDDLQTGT